ncbi:cytochrome b [Idiomarina xiamenensis]|uniref:Cytochrome B561 n=1 Tax=Idiomarina xiamenensis 10-D-4 TaxID=740709 RepID=K2JBG6_9GAMM|nr:cytochrome b [Idiomarina xiamenensis]EKE80596.1 cytochrome B561 [Idiomarina xiamenensis 10-D-4]
MWRNSNVGYGWLSVAIHWLSALAVIGLFVLGYWMVTLTYYSEWYRLAPWWHKSIGILLLALTVLRLLWLLLSPAPTPLGSRWQALAAKAGHILLYVLLLLILVSGYLISTADGQPISVFDWFHVPALITGLPQQADIAGSIHWYAALSLIILAAGHALIAVKHHFFDKDDTLKRMLGKH